eukprot:g21127.t1
MLFVLLAFLPEKLARLAGIPAFLQAWRWTIPTFLNAGVGVLETCLAESISITTIGWNTGTMSSRHGDS